MKIILGGIAIVALIGLVYIGIGKTAGEKNRLKTPPPEGTTVGEFWGTIVGTVQLGPICPVVIDPPDPSCEDKPYKTRLVLTTTDQAQVIKEFASNADGTFSLEAPPGKYAIRSAASENILPYCQADPFTLPANDSVEVTVYCDTGIR